jgi:hypothetical protein
MSSYIFKFEFESAQDLKILKEYDRVLTVVKALALSHVRKFLVLLSV